MGSDPQQPCITVELRDRGLTVTSIRKIVDFASFADDGQISQLEAPASCHKSLLESLKDIQTEVNTTLTQLITSKADAKNEAAMDEVPVEDEVGESDSGDETSSSQKRTKSSPAPSKKKHCN